MKKKLLCLMLVCVMLAGLLSGCGESEVVGEPVTLTVVGGWTDCKAIEEVGREFTKKYKNVTVVYEYLQDYYKSAEKRMTGDNPIDIFFSVNLQDGEALTPYALDLYSVEGIDLSETFKGLIDNFEYRQTDESAPAKIYSLPLGAELRGMYINKTLLESLDIEIPTDQSSLLSACEKLKAAGYSPFQGNPADFGKALLYPWVCNLIANAPDPAAAYATVASREAGVSEMFREPFEFLYKLIENYYFDYKMIQNKNGFFTDTTDDAYAKYFLNIVDGQKLDDVGQVAFMPSVMSMQSLIAKTKDDYHSEIEYEFVTSPVGSDGGFAYMSPAHGIAVNKDSANIEWAVKFMNFLFTPEINKIFAEEFNIVPNTAEAFDYISELFDIPDNHISHLGEVTFDYDFYNAIVDALVETSKGNNPKYMQQNSDGTTSLYPFEHYMNSLEEKIRGNE